MKEALELELLKTLEALFHLLPPFVIINNFGRASVRRRRTGNVKSASLATKSLLSSIITRKTIAASLRGDKNFLRSAARRGGRSSKAPRKL